MSAADRAAAELAACFPVSARLLARGPAFRDAVGAALEVMGSGELVNRIVDAGGLRGARNPYGVLIIRVRQATEDHREEQARRAAARVSLRPGEPRPASLGWVDVAARGAR